MGMMEGNYLAEQQYLAGERESEIRDLMNEMRTEEVLTLVNAPDAFDTNTKAKGASA